MGLASTAAKLLASLDLDTKPFERGAKRAGVALSGMERRFGKIGGMAQKGLSNAATNLTRIGIVAAGAIALAVRGGIQSLAELERANQQTGAVIESTGGKAGVTAEQVRSLAESLEAVTTADDKAIQSGENLLLTFTNIGSETFPQATKAMVDMAIAMAEGDVVNADFAGSAKQIGKALQDPVRGMTALRKSGVSFTKEQEDQIKTLVKAGKTTEAQRLILKELEIEFGKAGEAAGTGFGGDIRRLDDAFEDTRMALATGFLPVIRKVADKLSTELVKPEVQEQIRKFGETLAGAFDKVLEIGSRLPWQQIGDSLKVAGSGAKAVFDAFAGMPVWVQTAVLTGWGLNKLSGGALTGIAGEGLKIAFKEFAGRGATPANPLFVADVAGGKGGGVVPGAKGGALGLLGGAFSVLALAAIADEFGDEIQGLGRELGREIPFALSERMAIGDWLGDLQWPFGPNGAPAWAAGDTPPKAFVPSLKDAGGSGGMSPDERQEANDTQTKLDNLDTRLQAVRDKTRDVKFATDQARIANVAATRTGDASIVAAIRGIQRPVINVNVSSSTTRVTYTTGTTLSRYYGKTVPI